MSGSLQLLDSKGAACSNLRFVVWRVNDGLDHKSPGYDLFLAEEIGFDLEPFVICSECHTKADLIRALDGVNALAAEANIPYYGAFGAVAHYKIADSMGRADKCFRHSMAYKYEDELFDPKLTSSGWNTCKTGLVGPEAVFGPIAVVGAVTAWATRQNITYVKDMMLGFGDSLSVYRSNLVIPKVHDSIAKRSTFTIPDNSPICGSPTAIVKAHDSAVLMCTNDGCKGKLLGNLSHAVTKNALNVVGLSEATIQQFIDLVWLTSNDDISYQTAHAKGMRMLERCGQRSVPKLLDSIAKSRNTSRHRFIYPLSIPLVV